MIKKCITCIFLLLFTLNISCDGNSNRLITELIGPEGGSVTSRDGKLILDIPAGALDEETEISIKEIEPDEVAEEIIDTEQEIESAYELSPDGLEFNLPVSVTTRINDEPVQEDGSISVPLVILFTESDDIIELVDNQEMSIDTDSNITTVTGEINHFSNFTYILFKGVTASVINFPVAVAVEQSPFDVIARLENNVPDLVSIKEVKFTENVIEQLFSLLNTGMPNIVTVGTSQTFTLPLNNSRYEQTLTYECDCMDEIRPCEGRLAFEFQIGLDVKTSLVELIGLLPERSVRGSLDIFCGLPDEIDEPITDPLDDESDPPQEDDPEEQMGCADFGGDYNLSCDLIADPFAIGTNFGDPYNTRIFFTIEPQPDGSFRINATGDDPLFIPLEGTAEDQQDGTCKGNAEGSGNVNGGNIDAKAEDLEFSFDGLNSNVWGIFRFNFNSFPADQDSTVYDCSGVKE